MKYCTKCGHEMLDEAVVCVGCGCAQNASVQEKEGSTNLNGAIKVFLILGTIFTSLMGLLIPLAWCIPMTISGFKKLDRNDSFSVGYKICTLLFVNTIAGILLFCRKEK